MSNPFGSYIVSWSFSVDGTGVLIVGKQRDGKVDIVNAFQDKEAYDIYKKLSGKKGE